MAKTLEERVRSALATDRVTITDLADVIGLAEAELERLGALHTKASADSINFALAARDRDESSALAARIGREVAAYAGALAELRVKLQAKRESDQRKASDADRAQALTERDILASEIPERYRQACDLLIGLARDILASDARMKALGMPDLSAEAVARGCTAFAFRGMPAQRIIEIRLPKLDDYVDLWPCQEQPAPPAISLVTLRRDAEMVEQEREAGKRRFHVRRTDQREGTRPLRHADGVFQLGYQEFTCWLYADQVEPARRAGMLVEPAVDTEMAGS